MRILYKTIIIFLIGFTSLQLSACKKLKDVTPEGIKAYGTLVVATNASFPPFEFINENGNMVGWDMDIAHELARRLGVELRVDHMSFNSVLTVPNLHRAHISMAGISRTAEREENLSFTQDVFNSSQVVVIRSADNRIKTPFDLEGMTVGAQEYTIGLSLAQMDKNIAFDEGEKILGTPKKAVSYDTAYQALMDLVDNDSNLDAVILDKFPALGFLEMISGLEILEHEVYEDYYAFAVKKGNVALLDWLKEQITDMKKPGGFFEITTKKWF